MKIAVIGSRNIVAADIGKYAAGADEIVSGGAVGIDTCAEEYARANSLKFTVFLPEYERYGRAAPIVRNKQIVDYADKIFAFWDGKSKGTLSVIKYAEKVGKNCEIIKVQEERQSKKQEHSVLAFSIHESLFDNRRLSAIIAINSLFVGFPRLFWMVYPK